MAKRKIGDVIWLALVCAKDDRIALVDAYRGDESQAAVKQAMADIRAFESLQMKLFGTTKTELQRIMSTMSSKSLLKMSSDEIDDAEQNLNIISLRLSMN
jgi:hypothetical protein